MNDLDKIEHALGTKQMHHETFERFAQDTLSDVYPGLSPILGGTDWGRDGDDAASDGTTAAPRLLVTSSRTLVGVAANLRRSIKSLDQHGVATDRLILANAASLSVLDRQSLAKTAAKAGKTIDASDIYDRNDRYCRAL
jgi:hypothetical protein